MNQSLQIGPLSLPYLLLLALFAIALGRWVARWMAKSVGIEAEPTLTRMLFVGLFAARLAYVWQWHDLYFDAPWSILDIRDGGWEPSAGVLAALLFGLQRAQREAGMRKPVFAAAITTGLVLMLGSFGSVLMSTTPVPLPTQMLTSMAGQPVSLVRFAGKPTVVNLWATWCPPCVREMPVMQQAQAANPDVNIVFVNQGEDAQAIARFLGRQRLTLDNVLLDPKRLTGAALGHSALPTTLFFDAQGNLADTRIGELSQATLTQRLSSLRSLSPPSPQTTTP